MARIRKHTHTPLVQAEVPEDPILLLVFYINQSFQHWLAQTGFYLQLQCSKEGNKQPCLSQTPFADYKTDLKEHLEGTQLQLTDGISHKH